MDGRTADGWIWTDRWTDGQTDRDRQMDRQMDGRRDVRTGGCPGLMDGNRQTDSEINHKLSKGKTTSKIFYLGLQSESVVLMRCFLLEIFDKTDKSYYLFLNNTYEWTLLRSTDK